MLLYRKRLKQLIFSSPEPKAHRWAYRICRPSLSIVVVVRRGRRPSWSSPTLFKHLLRNHWAHRSQTSYGASMGWENESLFKRSRSHDQDGRHAHIWKKKKKKKNLKKFSSLAPKGKWPLNLVCSIECSSTTKSVQMMTLGWPWPILFYDKVKFGPLCFYMGKR